MGHCKKHVRVTQGKYIGNTISTQRYLRYFQATSNVTIVFSFPTAAIVNISLSKTLTFESAREHACSANCPRILQIIANDSDLKKKH